MNRHALGIDTSNYTTSAAVFDGDIAQNSKKLLPVAPGSKGLRQSDAVFAHVRQMDLVLAPLLRQFSGIGCIGVSDCPTTAEGSYMPCFEVGAHMAEVLAAAYGVSCLRFSHQQGHVAAALYSAGRLDLLKETFLAFHVSGGTTEALLVEPAAKNSIKITCVAQSADLKAGQAIDRAGVMLGLDFPCGVQLEQLALQCDEKITYRPSIQGMNVSMSGIENQCKALFAQNRDKKYIAKFCIEAVCAGLEAMCSAVIKEYGTLPIVFSGGVSGSVFLRERLAKKYGALFAAPEFSADNAAGVAILAYLKGYEI